MASSVLLFQPDSSALLFQPEGLSIQLEGLSEGRSISIEFS